MERQRRAVLDEIRARGRDATTGHRLSACSRRRCGRAILTACPTSARTDTVAALSRRAWSITIAATTASRGLTIGGGRRRRAGAGSTRRLRSPPATAVAAPGGRADPPSSRRASEGVEMFRAMPADHAQVVIGYPGDDAARSPIACARGAGRDLSGPSGRLPRRVSRSAPVRARVVGAAAPRLDCRGHRARFTWRSPFSAGAEPRAVGGCGACRAGARRGSAGVTPEEVGRARRDLIGAHAVALEPRSALAAALAAGEVDGQGLARVPPLRRRRSNRITPPTCSGWRAVHSTRGTRWWRWCARPTTIRPSRAARRQERAPRPPRPARRRQERGARARPEETTVASAPAAPSRSRSRTRSVRAAARP